MLTYLRILRLRRRRPGQTTLTHARIGSITFTSAVNDICFPDVLDGRGHGINYDIPVIGRGFLAAYLRPP